MKREIFRTVESQMSIISLMTTPSVMDPEGDLEQRSMSFVWFLLCFWCLRKVKGKRNWKFLHVCDSLWPLDTNYGDART